MQIAKTEINVKKLQGNGDVDFILIHNAGGNHNFFTHQIELLKRFGNVIWIDLPGHNGSKEISNYQMENLSSFVSEVCLRLSLKNICLIGLNNGADIVSNIMHFNG